MNTEDEIPNDIRVAVIGNMINQLLEEEKVYASMHRGYQKYHWRFTRFRTFIVWSMMLIIVFMKPSWCYEKEQKKENRVYKGGSCTVFVDSGKIFKYYRSDIPLLTAQFCALFNWVGFSLLILIQSIRLKFSYSFSDKVKLFNLILCILFDVILYFYSSVNGLASYGNAVFRLCFCITYQRNLRKSLIQCLQIVWKSKTVIILFLMILWIFATIGRALFYDEEGSQPDTLTEHYLFNFNTVFSTMYTLFILSTLDNFPDLQLGIYHESPILMLYYVIFAIFGGVVILSVLTGVFYTNFIEFYNHNVEILLRDKEYRDLIKRCLDDKILNFENINKVLNEYIQAKRIAVDKLKDELEEESSEEDSIEDLMKSFEISGESSSEEVNHSDEEKKRKDAQLKKLMRQNVFGMEALEYENSDSSEEFDPEKVHSRRKKGQTLEIQEVLNKAGMEEIEHFRNFWAYALLFTTIDFITMMIPVIQLESYGKNMRTNYYLYSEVLNVISLVDPILTQRFEGKKAFMKSLNLFKVGLSISLIVLSNILQFIPSSIEETEIEGHKLIYRIWCILSLLKMLSVHDLLTFSAEYNLIISTFTQIMPLLSDLFLMEFLLMLIYSVIGVNLLGGRVSTKSIAEYPVTVGEKLEDYFEYLSFNDVPSAMLFLFSIIAQNDWSKISTMAMMEYKKQREIMLCRIYFFSFYWVGFVVVSNIIIGAILDFIGTYLTILEEEKEEEKNKAVGLNIFDMIAANRASQKKNKKKKKKNY